MSYVFLNNYNWILKIILLLKFPHKSWWADVNYKFISSRHWLFDYFKANTLISHQFESGFSKLFYFWNFHIKCDELMLKFQSKYIVTNFINLWHLNIIFWIILKSTH